MSCLWFWCCRGQQADSDTENKVNDEQLKNGGKIKKKKKWRTRKSKEQQKKEKTTDVEQAENSQASQQPAAGEKESEAPLIPAGLESGSLENISAVMPEKMGTPLHEHFQTSEDIPEASSDLRDTSLDQIEAEAEAEAITPLTCTDLEEQEENNQPLENVELTMTTAEAEAEAIEQLMNIYLDETEDSMEQHLAGDEMFEATLTEAEVEAVKQLMLLFIDQIEAESLGSEAMNITDTEPEVLTLNMETYLDEVDTPDDHPLAEEEMPEVMDMTQDEAEVIKDLVHLELQDTETENLAGDEMFDATLTEAEVEAVKQLMLLYIDKIEAESLGSEAMNITDTEPEVLTLNMETYLDEVDTPDDHPLGCEVMSTANTEAEASGLNMQTHLDETVTPNDHPLVVEKTSDAETDWNSIKGLMADLLSDVERTVDHSLGNEMDKVTDAEAEADELNNLKDIQVVETEATVKQALGNIVEMMTDPEPIKSWADIIDETEETINQSAEIKPLKNDSPGNEAKTNQKKKKTRRGTRGKGRKINYKKGPRREE
ncbi:hypothetical protein MHYP_G00054780 [Metynnis hypsauchen]